MLSPLSITSQFQTSHITPDQFVLPTSHSTQTFLPAETLGTITSKKRQIDICKNLPSSHLYHSCCPNMSALVLVKNSNFINFQRNKTYFLKTSKTIVTPFESLKFEKYHYYKISNVLPLQTLNQFILLYNVEYLLVGGWTDAHLSIHYCHQLFLVSQFPNHKDFTASTP